MRLVLALTSLLALLAVAGCGGSGSAAGDGTTATTATTATTTASPCGTPTQVPAGPQGGKYGGTQYTAVPGSPIVSSHGGGTSCADLLALANEYAAGHVGDAFFQWLSAHGWTWMNADPTAFPNTVFDTDTYDVFVGTSPGKQSQVAFRAA